MNLAVHDQLNKLRIIGKIRPGQRIDTTTGLTIYEDSFLSWVYRKYYRGNKNETVRVLQDLYRNIDQSVEQLITDIKNIKDDIKFIKKIRVVIMLAEKIKESIAGIENLAKTYHDYPKIIAELEGVIQDYAINIYVQLIDIIPIEKLTKVLKSNITYNGIVLYYSMISSNDDLNEDSEDLDDG